MGYFARTTNNDLGGESEWNNICGMVCSRDAGDFCLWAPCSVDTVRTRDETSPHAHQARVWHARVYFVGTGGRSYEDHRSDGDGDGGGELNTHRSDTTGNPVGGLVHGNTFSANLQYAEWRGFIGDMHAHAR